MDTPTVDLTPFGYTPTESAAYQALLLQGPSTGYGIAKTLGVARANAYQALDGLVAKGAASIAARSPTVYRATASNAVLASVSRSQARHLETLEHQLASLGGNGAPTTVPFEGDRELHSLVLRTAARHSGMVQVVAEARFLAGSVPVWRKRAADGHPTELRPIGDPPEDFPLPYLPPLDMDGVRRRFGAVPVIVSTSEATILASTQDDQLSGVWSSDPLFVGVTRSAVEGLGALAR
jgi:Sugar-specific transcriptional regulator TrmB